MTEYTARYMCKECGAESPTGIGYVLHANQGERFVRYWPSKDCPNEHLEPLPRPFHGAKLLAALPFDVREDGPRRWIILVREAGELDSYVTGQTNALDAPEWYWGHYHLTDLRAAIADLYKRAGYVKEEIK